MAALLAIQHFVELLGFVGFERWEFLQAGEPEVLHKEVGDAIQHRATGCVEPVGADTMRRSLEAGRPVGIERVQTIADSLGAPYAMPVSFGLCQRYLDGLVLVDDEALREAMRYLLQHAKLAVEPAGAAATAALLGPLRERLAGRKVGLIVCGSNIDAASFARLVDADGPE